MKILHVVRQFSPAVGGLESYVKSMVSRQQALGHDCEVLTLNKVFHSNLGNLPEREMIDGISVYRVPFIGFRRYFLPFVDPRYFRSFDIIHVHNTDVFYDYIACMNLFLRKPLFATTHGGFFHTNNFSLIKKVYFNTITRFSSLQYKALFAISQNDLNNFQGLNKNIVFQPNAVESLGDFISEGQDFVYLGRLAKHKNVDQLIKAHAVLVKKYGIAANLRIIGPEWDVTLDELSALARQEGLEDHVIFHGCLAPADMPVVLRECRYFVSASGYEGFGMSMLEAMSVGLIPFVQPNEAFKELIGLAQVGACVDFSVPAVAAENMAERLASVTYEQQLAAQKFSSQYSWDILVASSINHYKDALE